MRQVEDSLVELEGKKELLDKRLNFLLEDEDFEMARCFKDEYKKQYLSINIQEEELIGKKKHLQSLQKQLASTENPLDHKVMQSINKALEYAQKKDLGSLRAIYQRLFQKIVVQPLDDCKVQLKFIFHGPPQILGDLEVFSCTQFSLVSPWREWDNLCSPVFMYLKPLNFLKILNIKIRLFSVRNTSKKGSLPSK